MEHKRTNISRRNSSFPPLEGTSPRRHAAGRVSYFFFSQGLTPALAGSRRSPNERPECDHSTPMSGEVYENEVHMVGGGGSRDDTNADAAAGSGSTTHHHDQGLDDRAGRPVGHAVQ